MATGDEAALGFDPDEFRSAIHTAMVMGSPNRVVDKATFRWDPARTYARHDPAGRPYSWSAPATSDTTHDPVTIDEVAVAYTPARVVSGSAVGEFVPLRGQITMLDVDHAKVEGANTVSLGDVDWAIVATTVEALFSVDVITLFIERQ